MLKLEKDLLIEQINKNGTCIIKVGGWCMMPKIKNNSTLEINKENNFNVGDIIAYFIKNNLFVHRISEINNTNFLMKSDFHNRQEHFINISSILGKINKIKNQNLIIKILDKIKWIK